MQQLACAVLVTLAVGHVSPLKLPGPQVYVVTPAPPAADAGRQFYYHDWMRRMDGPSNATATADTAAPTTTTPAPPVKTPDLIFAEFESDQGEDMRKSIRKLLEKERVQAQTSTPKPTVPDMQSHLMKPVETQMRYPAHGTDPAPVYSPAGPAPAPAGVENVWHIIDEEKAHEPAPHWEEYENEPPTITNTNEKDHTKIDENFALPGFATNPGNDGENESRAIRTDTNMKFPYVNLKPFLMTKQRPNAVSGNSKDGGAYVNLNNFYDIKHPVRGEAQEYPATQEYMREPIDRYNPAQPYLPEYGLKVTKHSSPIADAPKKSVAKLVPPPPPLPPPRGSSDDFPAPSTYDSFPPYDSPFANSAPPAPPAPPAAPPAPPAPVAPAAPPADDTPLGLGYNYKPPARPFLPTEPPKMSMPFPGYSYEKPAEDPPMSPAMSFDGYSYPKPAMDKPSYGPQYAAPQEHDHPPSYDTYPGYPGYGKGGDDSKMSQDSMGMMPPPPPAKPDSTKYGAHYGPDMPDEHPPYGHGPSDYPELIFDKPHGMKGGDDAKPADMPAADGKPDAADDQGFPPDFPNFKYHDFDDHDHDHYHHHHPTTTTTTSTTESPRVNRYSYYYLGKKLYYLPLYFSVYFIVYVGALIIKAVLRHKIVYPNSWRPNDQTASFFTKRSADWDLSDERLHQLTGSVTGALAAAARRYMGQDKDD